MKEELKPCRKCGVDNMVIITCGGSIIPSIKCQSCKHEESALSWNNNNWISVEEEKEKC